jgi:hypothetical protein
MRSTLLRKSLLIIALALSQWLVAAHALQHPALAQDQACQICLHAQGLDSGAVAALPAPALSFLPSREQPTEREPALAPVSVAAYYPIRAPPLLAG